MESRTTNISQAFKRSEITEKQNHCLDVQLKQHGLDENAVIITIISFAQEVKKTSNC